jgi:hypothetical protein
MIKLLTALAGALVLSCSAPPPPRPARVERPPQWADVFDGTPDIYGVVRVRSLKRDALYGTFWQSLLRVAQARDLVGGTTMVEAAEGAEEIVIGVSRGVDAAIVFRSVPASLDPTRINDAQGRLLFHPVNDRSKIAEYELDDRRNAEAGALFVLPDRTWVGTLGAARARARRAFASPANRPAPKLDAEALIALRCAGPLVHAFDRHPTYGPLTKKLSSVTFTLKPGKGGLVVALAYPDADAAAWSEARSKRILEDLMRDDKRLSWLKDATVAYEGTTVFIRLLVPPRLIEELPNASASDFGF